MINKYDLISNSNGIRKYGFYYNLKNKHKIKIIFLQQLIGPMVGTFFILKYFQIIEPKQTNIQIL